jgi:hypothetical protein
MRRLAIALAIITPTLLLLGTIIIGSGQRLRQRLGAEGLNAWGAYLAGTGTVLIGLGAIYAAIQGIREYGSRTKTEHMRWLQVFYERFYGNKRLRVVRQHIDFNDDGFAKILSLIERDKNPKASFDPKEKDLFDDFTDYLNFFEMLVYLKCQGRILEEELESMFGYYLRSLKLVTGAHELLEYLQRVKFTNLHDYLVKCE